MNKSSTQAPTKLIVPGDSSKSYLFCKIDPNCTDRLGDLMPRGASAE
ncbi:MAG: hypothetical protein U0165_09635 [Polyangiaceae bacterium]